MADQGCEIETTRGARLPFDGAYSDVPKAGVLVFGASRTTDRRS
jgi:hypothetical protein